MGVRGVPSYPAILNFRMYKIKYLHILEYCIYIGCPYFSFIK